MESLLFDLRYAARTLVRSRGFTVAAVACLALGIGANSAIFSMVNAILLRPFPFERPEQVVAIRGSNPAHGMTQASVSAADLLEWRAQSGVFQDVAAASGRTFTVAGAQAPERAEGAEVTPNTFALLGAPPLHGRSFVDAEGRPGGERVAMVSHTLWRRRFGERPWAAGATLLLDGAPHAVVGVMPPGFKFPETAQVWVPTRLDPAENRGARYYFAVGRLREGVTPERAHAAVAAVARRQAAEHPATNAGWEARVTDMRDDAVEGSLRAMLFLMQGAVGFVLLIACANVASLLLARASGRRREMAVRTALGAGRGRLVRQLLAESALVAVAGGVLGAGLSVWWVEWMAARIPEELPYWLRLGVDGRVLAFTAAVSLGTGVLFGLAPALRASRADPHAALKAGGHGAGGAPRSRGRLALVAGEVALATVLLVGAMLMIRSFLAASRADLGFETSRVLTMRTWLAGDRYATEAQRAAFYAEAARRLETLPGIERAAVVTTLPATGDGASTSVRLEGAADDQAGEVITRVQSATAGLFAVLGVPMAAGRDFTAAEAADPAAEGVIVSRALAERLWPGRDAVGRRLNVGMLGPDAWTTVVGVAPELVYAEPGDDDRDPRFMLYVPAARAPWSGVALVARTRGEPGAAAAAVRRELRALDPGLPAYDVRTMDQVLAYATWPQRLFGEIFASFGVLALGLAAIGVYGVMAYAVAQRTREIGVRMALGARAGDVLRMVMRQGVVLIAVGMGVGLPAALALARLMAGALYGVTPADPAAFVLAPLVLAAAALLASWLPARRAARVDPMVALRSE